MERKEFFELAQKAAVYTRAFNDIQLKPVDHALLVEYKGYAYYPSSITVGYDENGEVYNQANLFGVGAFYVQQARLEDVRKYDPNGGAKLS